ncbi:MAG TPA: carboxymuconolactone decarboxylase family protein [Planctomycetota bacterium]|nr:carboxymuconolactone decarboxylase family protein [Planctomycetota bacterium]
MSLSPRERRLARLFTVVVQGDWDRLREERQSAPDGEPDRGWRECVLQAHVFAGFPRVVEAYGVLAACGGLGALEPGEALAEDEQPERGRALFERIYGKDAPRVRETLRAGHPDFERWIEGHAYGRILSRPGLDPRTRELLAVAGLAALGQDRQVASHARGALRCGAKADEVSEVIAAVADLITPERLERARTVVAHFAGS